jgi:type IV pilus assembly protein PilQ
MLKRASSLVILMVLAASSVPIVWADVPAVPAATGANALPQATVVAPESTLVSLDFQDADIRNVLKVLAFKSGVNIVAAPDVTGVVNIELKDVPWQKALDVILSTYGYGFDRKDNIITVMTVEKLKKYREDSLALESQEPLVSKTFTLSFAKAEDVMKIIDKLISKRGFINFDQRTNSVIIRDLEGNLVLIGTVIRSLDTVTPQVLIETKVIETDLGSTENMGVDWNIGGSISGGSVPTYFPFSNKPVSSGIIPATTAAVPGVSKGSVFPATGGLATVPTPGSFIYGTINAQQLTATLNILSTRTTAHTLSNPRVVTLDNEKTTVNVGIQYPEANYSFNAQTGQQQVTGYTFLPIGVNFEVTPHVNNPGLITLDVHPQISAIDNDASIPVPTINGNSFPILSNEDTETKVMVENGKTLVIAGLIKDTTTVSKTKVPFLGSLPFIGSAFRSSSVVKSKTELLIFITPHVITVDKKPDSTTAIQ